MDEFSGRTVIAAESAGRREALLELFRARSIHPHPVADWGQFMEGDEPLSIMVAPLDDGLLL